MEATGHNSEAHFGRWQVLPMQNRVPG
jgi:hypothetical protein